MHQDCILIPLSQGKHAIIDSLDLSLVAGYRWKAVKNGSRFYASCWHRGATLYMHRLILPPGDGLTTDHINRDGLDNRRSNLRLATQTQQNANTRLRSDNTSGYRGVSWDKVHSKWMADIYAKGRRYHLGRFASAELAARAYDEAAQELFGEFASLNLNPEQHA